MRRTCHSARAVFASHFTVAALCTALCTAALAAFAQAPSRDDDAPVVFKATTELVQFDAVVVDADGRPVGTLLADDFEVRQDGQVVELRDVTFIDRTARLRRLDARRVGDEDVVPRAGIDVDRTPRPTAHSPSTSRPRSGASPSPGVMRATACSPGPASSVAADSGVKHQHQALSMTSRPPM